MTYQRDTERPITTPLTPEEIARREDNALREAEIAQRNNEAARSGFVPIALILLLVLGGGYLVYSMLSPSTLPDTPRTTEYSAPRTTTPTPTPTPPASPETK